MAIVSDVIDFGNWRNGIRREGITYSMFNFSRKIGQSIADGFAGIGSAFVGYAANAQQTSRHPARHRGLQTLYPASRSWPPRPCCLFLYKLVRQRTRIVEDLHVHGYCPGPESLTIRPGSTRPDSARTHRDTDTTLGTIRPAHLELRQPPK